MLDLMVDLETLGQGSRAAIRAIGAVFFDREGVQDHAFYAKVDLQSCVDVGLELDVDTMLWWLAQSEEARAEFRSERGVPLAAALADLSLFIGSPRFDTVRLWGNGASFDNAILSSAYRALRLIQPWKFWNDRCYRTVKAMRPDIRLERTGAHHNALDDARSQARHLVQIWGGVT